MRGGYRAAMSNEREDRHPGQLSAVPSPLSAGLVTPGDSVAGHPVDDDVDEGATGPDALTGDQDDPEEYRATDLDPEAAVDETDDDLDGEVPKGDPA